MHEATKTLLEWIYIDSVHTRFIYISLNIFWMSILDTIFAPGPATVNSGHKNSLVSMNLIEADSMEWWGSLYWSWADTTKGASISTVCRPVTGLWLSWPFNKHCQDFGLEEKISSSACSWCCSWCCGTPPTPSSREAASPPGSGQEMKELTTLSRYLTTCSSSQMIRAPNPISLIVIRSH